MKIENILKSAMIVGLMAGLNGTAVHAVEGIKEHCKTLKVINNGNYQVTVGYTPCGTTTPITSPTIDAGKTWETKAEKGKTDHGVTAETKFNIEMLKEGGKSLRLFPEGKPRGEEAKIGDGGTFTCTGTVDAAHCE